MDIMAHVHPENGGSSLFFFAFNMKSKCIPTSFVLNFMKILKSGKQKLESGKYIPVDGDKQKIFASAE